MTTGITIPGWSLVVALNSLQNAMMFTPCWPSAGPTGGAGLACPAGICNLICPVIFFAIFRNGVVEYWSDGELPEKPPAQYSITPVLHYSVFIFLAFFHLPILQFHRGIAAENVHGHFQFAAIG